MDATYSNEEITVPKKKKNEVEKLYNEKIKGMISEIWDFCNEHKIPMACYFALDESTIASTTRILKDDKPPIPMLLAASIMRSKSPENALENLNAIIDSLMASIAKD